MEPGLVSKKEAYKKIPDMCLAYYESKWEFCVHCRSEKITSLFFRLIWKDAPPKPVKEEAEMANGVNNVNLGETKKEEGVKTETKEKSNGVENGNTSAPPRAPSPVLHSYSWIIPQVQISRSAFKYRPVILSAWR